MCKWMKSVLACYSSCYCDAPANTATLDLLNLGRGCCGSRCRALRGDRLVCWLPVRILWCLACELATLCIVQLRDPHSLFQAARWKRCRKIETIWLASECRSLLRGYTVWSKMNTYMSATSKPFENLHIYVNIQIASANHNLQVNKSVHVTYGRFS